MISRAPLLLFAFLANAAVAYAESLPDDWAFRPLKPRLVPQQEAGNSSNPIDAFIRAQLTSHGLKPAAPASRRVLIRRVYFDLIGLPPAPEEVEAFVHDKRLDAFERVVDRLLTSPQHGERWARHWLDVVRFGESQGFEYDRIRDNAWRYRDYIINAFNADKPYDQFIREQLAGDVIEPVTREGIIATGFLVAGPWDQAGSGAASPSVRAMVREAELEDMVGTIGQTFLGVTLNCARCHNHKFDPIPQRDYYRIKAVFQGVRHGERSLMTKEEETRRVTEAARRKKQLAEVELRLAQIETNARTRVMERRAPARRGGEAVRAGQEPGAPVQPFARWTFETNAQDSVGSLHARLEGGARIINGRLALDGKEAFAITEPLKLPLREKTLEAWVGLATLEQGGGGIVTVEADDGRNFDGIVFAERQPRRWVAGSEFYRRTHDLELATDETTAPGQLIHIALVYHRDHTVALFRNGQPYGEPYQWTSEFGAFDTFPAGSTRVLFGKRHTGGGKAMFAGEIEEARLYDRALNGREIAASFSIGPDVLSITHDEVLVSLTESESQERKRLVKERDGLLAAAKDQPAPPMGYVAKPEKPDATFVLLRGEPDKPREPVVAGALSAIAKPASELGLSAEIPEAERRRRFADWVASPENPLTARAIVNRVWHYHFGRGLVATPNDFGKMGERPSHPELLDWLAAWFVSPDGANWSLKKLHRLMVTSETWRSSSESVISRSVFSKAVPGDRQTTGSSPTDSLNTDSLITGYRPRRLEAEAVRDAMLAVSGELNPQTGGPGFRPFRHIGSGGQNEYFASDPIGPEFNRRTVYRICVHSARDPLLDSLDCPEFSTRTATRPSTTTPLQALSLMNNSFVQRQAKKLAERIEREADRDAKAQVKSLWLRCYARQPRADELRAATKLAHEQGLESVAWAVLNSNEFVFVR
jgi:hypothetical protein